METPSYFKALLVSEKEDSTFTREITELPISFLPQNEVLIKVLYSSLNYKDGLSASGNKGVTRNYPHIPGIDAAGTVVSDSTGTFKNGDQVAVTGFDLGMDTSGGFGEYISVPTEWVIPKPENLSLKQCMIFGTAGYTAAYGLLRLERELIFPESGDVLVTGATGGVGSMAVFMLAQKGYKVIAATGKMDQKDFLMKLGASEVIHRDEVAPEKLRLLNSGRFAGVIDTVGGSMLETIIPQIAHNGAIACCGNVLGHNLSTNIYPFILRGISLLGIDSGISKRPVRFKIWESLSELGSQLTDEMYSLCTLDQLNEEIDTILEGKQVGRVVLRHDH